MNVEQLLKKLEEIKEDVYNNVHSADKKSPLQVESVTEFPIEEDAAGEEVKIERTKGEKVKEIKTLSRATSMGPNTPGADKSVYITDGSTKKSYDPIQMKLDIFKFQSMMKALPEKIDIEALKRGQREALEMAQEYLQDLEDMPEEMRDGNWLAEVEQAKAFIADLEGMLFKSVKKNDPLTIGKLILQEGPKNDKEAEIHLMLQDAVDKNNVDHIQQILMMLPQGM
jgi:hypothetical protein